MPSVSRLRGELRDGLKAALGPALKLTGQKLATKADTEAYLDSHATAVNDAVRLLEIGTSGVQGLEILTSGLVRVNGRMVLDPDYGNRAAVFGFGQPTLFVDHAAVLWSHLWTNFYHFVVDLLPKLCALQDAFGPTLGDRRLCYPRFRQPFEDEYLELLGLPADHVIDTRRHRKISVTDDVAMVTLPGWSHTHPYATVVRDRLSGAGTASAAERVYISRTGRRSVTNDEAVTGSLERWGFTKIDDVPRTVVDQIGIFANASVVVGAHGGALSNLIWCRPGTVVMELLPASYQPPYFEHLSDAMGLSYHRLVEDGAPEDEGHWTAQGEHQTVNIARLEDLVGTLLAR